MSIIPFKKPDRKALEQKNALQPRPGFNWDRIVWSAPTSPRSPVCSRFDCLKAIGENDVPLIVWRSNGAAAQFCDDCAARWFGLVSFREQ